VARVAPFVAAWVTLPWLIVSLFLAGVVPGGWRLLLTLLAAVLVAGGIRVSGFAPRRYPGAFLRRLVFVPFYYVFLFLPLVAINGLVGALVGWPFIGPLAGGRVAIAGVIATFITLGVAGYLGSRRLVVKRLDITHPHVPREFDGLRLVQLSDLHVGPQTSRAFLAKVADLTREAAPDIIAFTGDQVDDFTRDVEHFVEAFGHLRAPLGVFAIVGNHDVYAGWPGVERGMLEAGIRVLVNDGVSLRREGATLWIGGTGDSAANQFPATTGPQDNADGVGVHPVRGPVPDLDRTMAAAPNDAFRVVLAHNPALWPGLVQRKAHLTLSGHTHHGQFSIPPWNWCLASPFVRYAMGRYEQGGSILYVSPGTNYWGIPLRLGAWPEVTVVTLKADGRR
jgi:uncharacterized protein